MKKTFAFAIAMVFGLVSAGNAQVVTTCNADGICTTDIQSPADEPGPASDAAGDAVDTQAGSDLTGGADDPGGQQAEPPMPITVVFYYYGMVFVLTFFP